MEIQQCIYQFGHLLYHKMPTSVHQSLPSIKYSTISWVSVTIKRWKTKDWKFVEGETKVELAIEQGIIWEMPNMLKSVFLYNSACSACQEHKLINWREQ